jgi:hypothetical protein
MRKKLSFCITCKNRLWQLKKTLEKNLLDNIHLKSELEFVLVDFDSRDGLKEWVKENFKSALAEGYLKYFFTNSLPYWHASIGKNTAHLYAAGEIVTNLDCDNFTGPNGGQFILDCFNNYKEPIVIHQYRGHPLDGSFGRISVLKKFFSSIGGYDEKFHPMAFEDADLIIRLWMSGLSYVRIKDVNYNNAIPNTRDESIAYCDSSISYSTMHDSNKSLSFDNIAESSNPVRNGKVYGIRENVYNDKGVLVEPPSKRSHDLAKLMKQYNLQQNYNLPGLKYLLDAVFALS